MKKTIALILALAMLLGLSSCGGNIGNTAYRPMNDIVLSKTNKTDSIDSDKPFPGDKFINPLSGELSPDSLRQNPGDNVVVAAVHLMKQHRHHLRRSDTSPQGPRRTAA